LESGCGKVGCVEYIFYCCDFVIHFVNVFDNGESNAGVSRTSADELDDHGRTVGYREWSFANTDVCSTGVD
jgi:hypothetical protein